MGTKYTTEAISGYNSSPPADDGTASEANKVKWDTHKTKLADPLKDQVANIDTKLVAMADVGPDAKTTTYTTVAGDHQKTLQITTASLTITLLAVASAPTGYTVTIKNNSGGTVDVDGTGAETIDGSDAAVTLADNETYVVQLNQAETGYISLQQVTLTGGAGLTSQNTFTKTQTWSKGADLTTSDVTAGVLAIGTDGNYFDFTGTDTISGFSGAAIGTTFKIHFDDAAPLTDSADLEVPGGNYTTAAGDEFEFTVYATNDVRCTGYALASGKSLVAINPLTSGAAITTTSGASHDFTSIPSWVKKITLSFSDVSTNGTSPVILQLGDSGGIETTGYLGTGARVGGGVSATSALFTTGMATSQDWAAAWVVHGSLTLSLLDSNTWVSNSMLGRSDAAYQLTGASSKTLSATLDRIRLTTVGGTDTFDAGTINILYE